jgi:hypothetical protein
LTYIHFSDFTKYSNQLPNYSLNFHPAEMNHHDKAKLAEPDNSSTLTTEDVKTLKLQVEAFLYLLDKRNVRREIQSSLSTFSRVIL